MPADRVGPEPLVGDALHPSVLVIAELRIDFERTGVTLPDPFSAG